MPTLMGRDSDDPQSLGEVGHCGVAIDSAADMEVLFDGIPLADVTTSMTISGPAVPVFCMYLVAAERQGADLSELDGTLQTDIFKEYIAQKEWLFPPEPHLRLIGDLMEYCAARDPARTSRCRSPATTSARPARPPRRSWPTRWPTASATSSWACPAGWTSTAFAPGLSFFFDAHVDFFEEIAKFRAARRIWARWLRDVYGATSEKALWLRFHTQTAGVSLTAQQPVQQRGPDRGRGAGRGARRHQLAAHQRAGRDPGAAHRRVGRDRAAHPAGADGGDRRDQRGRPARRLLVRRGAHRPDRGRGRGDLRPDPRAWRRAARSAR